MDAPDELPGDVAALLSTPAGWQRFCTAIGLHLTLEQLRAQREAERRARVAAELAARPLPPQVLVRQAPLGVIRTTAPLLTAPASPAGLLRPTPALEVAATVLVEPLRPGGNRAHRRKQKRVSPTP
ncbi:hypothetical protein [Deinococcus rufus]|uniref:Uncharacterized protein n=1 Tax=Deinococcus rufus TaxID=2136097 RepID=A0ABV7ZBJ4_9DEIO